jgi:hypothetical protein
VFLYMAPIEKGAARGHAFSSGTIVSDEFGAKSPTGLRLFANHSHLH